MGCLSSCREALAPLVITGLPEGGGWRHFVKMIITALGRAPGTGDAGQVTDREPVRPDTEVPERARRRTFTAAYKQEVLAA
jgi:hypothetical protein